MVKFESRNGRTIEKGQRVMVYRNLHNGKFSVADAKTERVLGYVDEIALTDCEFRVRQGGREKVIREKKKNVHAFVIGNFAGFEPIEEITDEVYYNPYKTKQFIIKGLGTELLRYKHAYLKDGRVFI
jgi:hypothetical protein